MKSIILSIVVVLMGTQTFAAGKAVANIAFATSENSSTWSYCLNIKGSQVEVYEHNVLGTQKIYGPVAVTGTKLPWGGDDISTADGRFAFYETQDGSNELNLDKQDGTLVLRRLVPVKSCPLVR